MFSLSKRAITALPVCTHVLQTRLFSPLAIYSGFPATLHYYSPKLKSSLFDRRELQDRPHDLSAEGVEVAADGLVYPKATRYESNGATLLPNTFTMQELIRNYYDAFLDLQESEEAEHAKRTEQNMEVPQIFTIPKGTAIPDGLTLIYEHSAWFGLQPSHGMPLKDLNCRLDEYFDKVAKKESVESWLASHPFEAANDSTNSCWKDV